VTASIEAMPESAPQSDWDPDDQRVLFRRIVDDILDQIEQGTLHPNAPLPSARKMAENYGVGVMTVQRALRELQQLRVTYSIAGKGTFVHPDIADLRDDAPIRKTLADSSNIRRLVAYLAGQQRILDRYDTATAAKDKNGALRDLLTHAQDHRDLIDQIAAHAPRSTGDTPHTRR
jgi:DNA-binding transcriptional regulator YhcF (GntR family)